MMILGNVQRRFEKLIAKRNFLLADVNPLIDIDFRNMIKSIFKNYEVKHSFELADDLLLLVDLCTIFFVIFA